MRWLGCLCLPLVLLASHARAADSWFVHESWTLPNGLQVVLIPNHRAPIAHVSVWYKTGGANDLPRKSGTAHYLEHLMFLGTKTVKPGMHSQTVKDWGGSDNAFTTQDVTAYFQNFPAPHLEDVLRMEASRMLAIQPSKKRAKNEHGVIQQERHQVIESDPQRLFSEAANTFFYAAHVYARPVIGRPNDIKALTLADAQEFHRAWYGPDNAIVVIAGDVTRKDAEKLVRRTFGWLPRIHPQPRQYLVNRPSPPAANFRVTKCDPRIEQPWLGASYPLPAQNEDMPLSLAAQVLATMLNGGPTSPLYKILVEEKKTATAIGVSYESNLQAAADFEIALWPTPGIGAGESFDALNDAMREAIMNRITEKDVRRTIRQIQLQIEMASDQPFSLAMEIGYALANGETLDNIVAAPQRLESVTLADIKRLALIYFFDSTRGIMHRALLPEGHRSCTS